MEALEGVARDYDAPHDHESCLNCRLDGFGDWVFCRQSRHHVDHERHLCTVVQECDCQLVP